MSLSRLELGCYLAAAVLGLGIGVSLGQQAVQVPDAGRTPSTQHLPTATPPVPVPLAQPAQPVGRVPRVTLVHDVVPAAPRTATAPTPSRAATPPPALPSTEVTPTPATPTSEPLTPSPEPPPPDPPAPPGDEPGVSTSGDLTSGEPPADQPGALSG